MKKVVAFLIIALGIVAYMYRCEQKNSERWRDIAAERARSLRVADFGLNELVSERRECISETVLAEKRALEMGNALSMCVENVVKKTYLEQVKRNCTIASNRLVRLAKLQEKL